MGTNARAATSRVSREVRLKVFTTRLRHDHLGGDENRRRGMKKPTKDIAKLAKRIADAIEFDLNDRRGMKWDGIDDDIQKAIRKRWREIIIKELEAKNLTGGRE
jgi:hypothetical protein